MQIKQTKFEGIAEVVTVLDGVEAHEALVRIARYYDVPLYVVRDELAAGLRVSTLGAVYEATVAPKGATVG